MTFEELKQEFIDHNFQVNGDSFLFEQVEYSTININGQVHRQPHKKVLEMTYIGEGSICDSGDSDDSDMEILYQFDILDENKEPIVTICIRDFEDFTKIL